MKQVILSRMDYPGDRHYVYEASSGIRNLWLGYISDRLLDNK